MKDEVIAKFDEMKEYALLDQYTDLILGRAAFNFHYPFDKMMTSVTYAKLNGNVATYLPP